MATAVETLILAIQTKNWDKAEQQLKKVKQEAQGAGTAIDNTGKAADRASKAFGKMRGPTSALTTTTGQLSVQFQDVAVQAQQGTDYLRIFAQQGPQIASVFGPAGAVTGAIIAFGALIAGPFVAQMMAGNKAIEESTKFLDEYTEGYDKLGEAQRRVLANMIEVQIEQERQAIEGLRDVIQKNNGVIREYGDLLHDTNATITETNAQTQEQKNKQDQARAAIELANAKIAEMQKRLELVTGARKEDNKEVDRANEKLATYIQRQERIAATKEMSIPMKMLYEATELAAEAGRKLTEEEIKRLQIAGVRLQSIKDQQAAEKALEEERRNTQKIRDEQERNRIAAERDLKRQGLLDVEQDEYDSYARRAAVIEEYRRKNEIDEQKYAEAKNNLEKQVKENSIKQFGEGITALGQYNKKAFEASKLFNVGQAIMNTYTGATKALATYPPPYNFIAAAGVVASGLAQVQSIRSQQYQGRAVGGQVRAGESYVVGERGPEVLTMGTNGKITPNEKLGGEKQVVNRNVNVSFQISTVDASGFDQLLQSRRGQIIGMINSAMNDQGRKALV